MDGGHHHICGGAGRVRRRRFGYDLLEIANRLDYLKTAYAAQAKNDPELRAADIYIRTRYRETLDGKPASDVDEYKAKFLSGKSAPPVLGRLVYMADAK